MSYKYQDKCDVCYTKKIIDIKIVFFAGLAIVMFVIGVISGYSIKSLF